jgi:hypothetical protein
MALRAVDKDAHEKGVRAPHADSALDIDDEEEQKSIESEYDSSDEEAIVQRASVRYSDIRQSFATALVSGSTLTGEYEASATQCIPHSCTESSSSPTTSAPPPLPSRPMPTIKPAYGSEGSIFDHLPRRGSYGSSTLVQWLTEGDKKVIEELITQFPDTPRHMPERQHPPYNKVGLGVATIVRTMQGIAGGGVRIIQGVAGGVRSSSSVLLSTLTSALPGKE